MKRIFSLCAASVVAAALGCSESQPGGPGVTQTNPPPNTTTPRTTTPAVPDTAPRTTTTTTANRPVIGDADGTFSLSMPILTTSMKQGETKSVTIGVTRGDNFDEDITLKMTGLPEGVSVEPANPMIKHGEKEATVQIRAANNAALGDFTINVVGHPTQGADAMSELKLEVTES